MLCINLEQSDVLELFFVDTARVDLETINLIKR